LDRMVSSGLSFERGVAHQLRYLSSFQQRMLRVREGVWVCERERGNPLDPQPQALRVEGEEEKVPPAARPSPINREGLEFGLRKKTGGPRVSRLVSESVQEPWHGREGTGLFSLPGTLALPPSCALSFPLFLAPALARSRTRRACRLSSFSRYRS